MTETTRPIVSPRDFFMHLLSIVSLYVSTAAVLMVAFQSINLFVPDAADVLSYSGSGSVSQEILRSGISMLLVFFPVFFGCVWYLEKLYSTEPQKRSIWVRKWLHYFTLFVAAVVLMITTVILVNKGLSGEVTTRFLLKIVSVFVVASSIFSYYLLTIRKDKALFSLNK